MISVSTFLLRLTTFGVGGGVEAVGDSLPSFPLFPLTHVPAWGLSSQEEEKGSGMLCNISDWQHSAASAGPADDIVADV